MRESILERESSLNQSASKDQLVRFKDPEEAACYPSEQCQGRLSAVNCEASGRDDDGDRPAAQGSRGGVEGADALMQLGKLPLQQLEAEESTRVHVDDTSTSNTTATPAYGYQWWVATADDHPSFVAYGRGGQLIEVVPDLDLVVAVSTHIPRDRPPRLAPATLVNLVDYVISRKLPE